ncbi:MAG: cytochrome-c oxidase, cbb3-type subunit II [Verrucomicrobiales bacterium]
MQDALVSGGMEHNAVAFFLTTPILGIMYYFMPKAANRPVYSYRLSIVHFWSLVFIYIWAGPHHLLNTALPQWLQYLGMFFSLMLWAPSWGGMLNGLLTLRGAWDKLRTDPVIKFFAVAVTFYGMSTFEGPLLSIRAVNSLSHYSDWTIGHVHGGTLGWNGFMAAGMFYWLAPRLWKTKLWSTSMANMHFWIGTVGILLYVASMWVAGISQGLQLNELNAEGTSIKYEFVQTLTAIWWPTLFRGIGGAFYLIGFLLLVINIFATIKSGVAEEEKREIFVLPKEKKDNMRWTAVFANDPIAYSFWGLVFMLLWFFLPRGADLMALVCTLGLGFMAVRAFKKKSKKWSEWYEQLLDNWAPFTVLVFIAVVIGGLVQLIPNVTVNRAANVEGRRQVPYTPLELAGRDIYVSEGCYNCHSQMIRTLLPDVLRYQNHTTNGYSRLGESIYDHPFQWGSKRTGPDLAREGGFRGDDWHYSHMYDPRSLSPYSNMPPYPWLFKKETDIKALPKKIAVQTTLGVPYGTMTRDEIEQSAIEQGTEIAKRLVEKGVPYYGGGDEPKTPADMIAELHDKQIVALIAYLQKLGTFEEIAPKDESEPGMLRPNTPDAHREKAKAALAKPDPSGAETASTR